MSRIDGCKRALLVVALVGTAGCGDGPTALSTSTLDSARARWLSSGIRDYDFEYRQQCECGSAFSDAAIVEVRQGRVAAVRYRDSGQPAAATDRGLFPTVDDLFARIEDAIRRNAASLTVTYDTRWGYPTRIDIDYDVQVADDEISIDASALTPR
ncbi:MAG: DUF6174 domain-containing protein [Gemmatimonadetes bacterium]|nr:DUF6174 domain-containing protein [Gemmatimonadota bacterium]